MSRTKYDSYKKFDVVCADFGDNLPGVQGGVRVGVVVSCDASNHAGAPQVSIVPLTSKLKNIPVHVQLSPDDVIGYPLKTVSDFMPEDIQTLAKSCIKRKNGYVSRTSDVRDEMDRALIRQLDLLPTARKMVLEEIASGQ